MNIYHLAVLDLNEDISLSAHEIMVELGVPPETNSKMHAGIAFVRKEIVVGKRTGHPICPEAYFVDLAISLVFGKETLDCAEKLVCTRYRGSYLGDEAIDYRRNDRKVGHL